MLPRKCIECSHIPIRRWLRSASRRKVHADVDFMDSFPSELELWRIFPLSCLGGGMPFWVGGHLVWRGDVDGAGAGRCSLKSGILTAVELLNYRLTHCEVSSRERSHFLFDGPARGRTDGVDGARGASALQHVGLDARSKAGAGYLLELELRPVQRTIGGRDYSGFSYRYRYRSGTIPIYKILDRGSWEIGGSALGNEFWMRNCFAPSDRAHRVGKAVLLNRVVHPRLSESQCFPIFSASDRVSGIFLYGIRRTGILVTWARKWRTSGHCLKSRAGKKYSSIFTSIAEIWGTNFPRRPIEVLWSAGDTQPGGACQ